MTTAPDAEPEARAAAGPSSAAPPPTPRPAPRGALRTALLPLARVLVSFVARLAGAALLVQLLLALAPGDAIDLLPNSDQLRPLLAAEWGLDRPLGERLVYTLGRLARGELGTSLTYRPGAPVLELVLDGFGRSAALLVPALLVGIGAALALAALSTGSDARRGLVRPAVRGLSVIPVFLGGYLAVMALNGAVWALMEQGLLDRPAWFALPDTDSALRSALAIALLAWASGGLSEQHAALEAELRVLRAAPFIEATRARGASVWPHLVWNLVPPVLALAAARTGALIAGLLVVEKVLLFNGAGAMLWQACRVRDYPLAIGITLGAAALVAGARLGADLLRIVVDPRLREAR